MNPSDLSSDADWDAIFRARREEIQLKKLAEDRLEARLQEIERELDRMRESSRPLVARAWLWLTGRRLQRVSRSAAPGDGGVSL